jgi:hypothetical protein
MTEDEILKIGVQAGMNPAIMTLDGNFKLLKTFAKLVAEREREACAKIVDVQNMASESTYKEQLETKDEPVATVISESGANVTHSWWHEPALPIGTKLYTSGWRKRQVQAVVEDDDDIQDYKKPWVGLTDDEVVQAMYRADAIVTGPMQFKFAKEIETTLKEKNT